MVIKMFITEYVEDGHLMWSITGSREERIMKARQIYETLEHFQLEYHLYGDFSWYEKDDTHYIWASPASNSFIARLRKFDLIGGIEIEFDPRGVGTSDLGDIARSDFGFAGRQAHHELGKRTLMERGGDLLINGPGTF